MSSYASDLLLLFCAGLVVAFRVYFLVRRLWNYPLDHGPGFFLGVEVAPGFYDGPGVLWLKRYRTAILTEHLVEALGLVVILISGRWDRLPMLAYGTFPFMATLLGFVLWTRHRLGPSAPTPSSVAVALEQRRVRDYISWPVEALVVVIIAVSWLLLVTHGDAQVRWQVPVLMTYAAAGLFPGKVVVARDSFPLPAERPEEHHRWLEAHRCYSLRMMDTVRWFLIAVLAGYALLHGWPAVRPMAWFRWLVVTIAMGIWLVMVAVLIRGGGRLVAMGRDLRPVGAWSGPFRSGRLMSAAGWAWTVAYLAGLTLLLVFFRR